jgi:hypothetical protein
VGPDVYCSTAFEGYVIPCKSSTAVLTARTDELVVRCWKYINKLQHKVTTSMTGTELVADPLQSKQNSGCKRLQMKMAHSAIQLDIYFLMLFLM